MSIKNDRRRSSKAIIPARYKGKVNRKKFDINGYDTLNKRKIKRTHKVYTGKRGGKYIRVKGVKRYL